LLGKNAHLGCAYMAERIKRIRHLRWKSGGHLPEAVKANLSDKELKWLTTYNEITYNFQSQLGEDASGLID